MKILVTGRDGQLGRALADQAPAQPQVELVAIGRDDADLRQPGAIATMIEHEAPQWVINAAAYTDVERAESGEEEAMRINAEAAGEAAQAAHRVGAAIIQVSTDFVFDGRGDGRVTPEAPTAPVNAYGRTKLAGEMAVRSGNPRHLIVRTAWLFSPWGRNFLTTMIGLAAKRDEVAVVDDEVGSPTSATDLARALLRMAQLAGEGDWGAWHVAARGHCSRADLAEAIFAASKAHGGPSARVRRIRAQDRAGGATRPATVILDPSAFEQRFGMAMPGWRDGVDAVVGRLLSGPTG